MDNVSSLFSPIPTTLFDSVVSMADLHSKRLLLVKTGEVLLLRNLNGRIGFLQRRDEGRHRWVWLPDDVVAQILPYSGPKTRPHAPDFQLEEWQ